MFSIYFDDFDISNAIIVLNHTQYNVFAKI